MSCLEVLRHHPYSTSSLRHSAEMDKPFYSDSESYQKINNLSKPYLNGTVKSVSQCALKLSHRNDKMESLETNKLKDNFLYKTSTSSAFYNSKPITDNEKNSINSVYGNHCYETTHKQCQMAHQDKPIDTRRRSSTENSDDVSPDEAFSSPAPERLNPRCILLQYFEGDTTTEVENHFTKALNQKESSINDIPSPMSKRNFPPSFWNSNYKHRSMAPSLHPFGAGNSYNLFKSFGSSPALNLYGAYSSLQQYRSDISPVLDPYLAASGLSNLSMKFPSDIGDSLYPYPSLNPTLPGQYPFSHSNLAASVATPNPYPACQFDPRYNPLLLQSNTSMHELATSAAIAADRINRQSLVKRNFLLC